MSGARRFLTLLLLAAALPAAADGCRIAYDMGSSGIRGGSEGSREARTNIDYLAPLLAKRSFDELQAPTITALRSLPEKGGFPAGCVQAGGGFSAWRMALEQDPERLAAMLARIREETGVAVFVIPQAREGSYGHDGARRLLGERLATSHVLDIGGGSLQVAGDGSTWGAPLGQKLWHHALCQELRNTEAIPCALQPMTGDELEQARALARQKLAGIENELPMPLGMTAISRPVSRGILPAVARIAGLPPGAVVEREALSATIERIARMTRGETAAATGSQATHAAWLLSDMLLVEALLLATDSAQLQVSEIELTNIPGLLADDALFSWTARYRCYLGRLREMGADALDSDPETCPEP